MMVMVIKCIKSQTNDDDEHDGDEHHDDDDDDDDDEKSRYVFDCLNGRHTFFIFCSTKLSRFCVVFNILFRKKC